MTDQELADALVEAGIGSVAKDTHHPVCYFPPPPVIGFLHVDEFITDWRVAGACLESMGEGSIVRSGFGWAARLDGEWISEYKSLPRAIIEAWYEARQ